jgi:hypothetical protein
MNASPQKLPRAAPNMLTCEPKGTGRGKSPHPGLLSATAPLEHVHKHGFLAVDRTLCELLQTRTNTFAQSRHGGTLAIAAREAHAKTQ